MKTKQWHIQLIRGAFFLLILGLLYGQLLSWQSQWLGIMLFASYLLFVGSLWQQIFFHVFSIRPKGYLSRLLAMFAVIILLGSVSSMWIAWYKVTPIILFSVYATVALITVIIDIAVRDQEWDRIFPRLRVGIPFQTGKKVLFTSRFRRRDIIVLLYGVALIASVVLLFSSRHTSTVLQSPWQVIHPYFLPVFFAASVLLGIIICSRYRVSLLLGLVVLHSLVLHLYLPFSHELPWGGDAWRLIAVETKLARGEAELPVIAGDRVDTKNIYGVPVPTAFLVPQKYTYGQFWGTMVLLNQTLQIDLLVLHQWFLPILWGLLLPLLLFRIGRILFSSSRNGVFLAALGLIPFSFQSLGSVSLPVSLGYLTFFFFFQFWLQYLHERQPKQRSLSLLFGGLMFFGYTLHALFFALTAISSFFISRIARIKHSLAKKSAGTVALCFGVLVFPVIEIVTRWSGVPKNLSLLEALRQFVGQFSGMTYALQIRPHDIVSGNIIFNHLPEVAYVANWWTMWRYEIVVGMCVLWLLALIAIVASFHIRRAHLIHVITTLSFIVFGGYIIGWYLMSGDRLFIRRLDGMVAFLLLILAMAGARVLWRYMKTFRVFKYSGTKKAFQMIMILFLSWFGTAAYASGPDLRVLSKGEYDSAVAVWNEEVKIGASTHCILADTWSLLAVEAVSGKEVVGGGFPIGEQFEQPERDVLYREAIREPRSIVLEVAKRKTGASACSFIIPEAQLSEEKRIKTDDVMGVKGVKFGDQWVWLEGLKNEGK